MSCPGPLLHLACFGGGVPVPFPPYLAWGCAPPVGWVCASEAFPCRGVGWGGLGGGRPVGRAPRLCGRGGQWGGGSLCLGPSLCLPWAGNKAGVTGVVLVMEGVAPIPLRFVEQEEQAPSTGHLPRGGPGAGTPQPTTRLATLYQR